MLIRTLSPWGGNKGVHENRGMRERERERERERGVILICLFKTKDLDDTMVMWVHFEVATGSSVDQTGEADLQSKTR